MTPSGNRVFPCSYNFAEAGNFSRYSASRLRGYIKPQRSGPIELEVKLSSGATNVTTFADGRPVAHRIGNGFVIFSLTSLTESIAVVYNDMRWVIFVALAVKLVLPDASPSRPTGPSRRRAPASLRP